MNKQMSKQVNKQLINPQHQKMINLQHKYTNPRCHHIASIYQQNSQIPTFSGNLFLSGIGGLQVDVISSYQISSVLTIMDQHTYQYLQVQKLIQKNNLHQQHKWLDLQDSSLKTIYPVIDQALDFVSQKIKNKNVLVHCYMGISRSATIVIAFLMRQFNMGLWDAYFYVLGIRDTIGPNQAFMDDLKRFEKDIQTKKQ